MFVFIGAHLRRQFEFVQAEWVNNGVFIGAGGDKDPIAGPTMGQESLSSHANQSEEDSTASLGSSSHVVVNIVSCQAYAPYVGWPI